MPNVLVTVLTIAVLALVIFLAIRKLVKDKKEGIGACGQKCANCPHAAQCHNIQELKIEN